ncbi:kynureninase [Flexivirga endophytica]|uniref:Kynureninase n=1 Tax=Flexivirga endophytica TaxID=1849103 RepID=A0A916T528_9MICO|nr:kynureninase [Flexivirga endophytica]GGB31153.1 kynureninase [Flexivirga endophytica]GHB52104.1 kynureninase [Flexivirga endophytica]
MTPHDVLIHLPDHVVAEAKSLDAADPLAAYREQFVLPDGVVAYLDGNSLGRPLSVTRDRLGRFVEDDWGERLIRAWDETWMDQPLQLGDRIGRIALGAAEGQTTVADSTTVLLYKLVRAAVGARPGRTRIVADTENFPTDRYIVQGVAAELDLTIDWIEPDPATGVTVDEVRETVSDDTALVLLSHIAYKSAFIADLPAITEVVHDAGALVLWDLCHSVGLTPIDLDAAGVDLAVGCTYKYLNGGPGAPAFGYVAKSLQDKLVQPINGWMGHAEPFTMGPSYTPADGMRRFISGTPPILGMLPMQDMLDLVEQAGVETIREKSIRLTEFVVDVADEVFAPLGVTVASPRDPAVRGGHVTLEHDAMQDAIAQLWQRGVIPDFRRPRGLRAGMSPLSTSFVEVATALAHLHEILTD